MKTIVLFAAGVIRPDGYQEDDSLQSPFDSSQGTRVMTKSGLDPKLHANKQVVLHIVRNEP
jgi:hypothetical protein